MLFQVTAASTTLYPYITVDDKMDADFVHLT